jgi:hypothetical protein
MSIRSVLISVALAAGVAPALANSGFTPTTGEVGFTTHAMPSTKTRAEVRKELEQARAEGSLWYLQRNYSVPAITGGTGVKTREQVRQELLNTTEAEKRRMRELYVDGQ